MNKTRIRKKFEQNVSKKTSVSSNTDSSPVGSRDIEFMVGMTVLVSWFIEDDYRLWVTDGYEVKVFHFNRPDPARRWFLPDMHFKCFLDAVWCNGLVVSDWEGSLFVFNDMEGTKKTFLRKAFYDDVPIHCLTAGINGDLFAAFWDGRVLAWDNNASLLWQCGDVRLLSLPTKIVPISPNLTAVFDKTRTLHLLDRNGNELTARKIPGNPDDFWVNDINTETPKLYMLEDHTTISCIETGTWQRKQVAVTERPVKTTAHNHRAQCSVFAYPGGIIDWFPWQAIRILPNCRVRTGFEIQSIKIIYDPSRPNTLIAVGLTDDGRLFSVCDQDIMLYDEHQGIRKFLPAAAESVLLCYTGKNVRLFGNPVMTGV
jgi:hypothetical protein